ncbi:hypothetical protein Taro_024331 [Colocasia esculenta]|uniref:Uncharacterized protein n=1 Tax=Colocasia esculenta TaxID=4460 RepID=A0A843V6J6_COLES|nr:hypothetical protein [Colocasia esculenta]
MNNSPLVYAPPECFLPLSIRLPLIERVLLRILHLSVDSYVRSCSLKVSPEVKKPTSWYKPQYSSARHKPLARFYTTYNPTAGQRSFLEMKEQR